MDSARPPLANDDLSFVNRISGRDLRPSAASECCPAALGKSLNARICRRLLHCPPGPFFFPFRNTLPRTSRTFLPRFRSFSRARGYHKRRGFLDRCVLSTTRHRVVTIVGPLDGRPNMKYNTGSRPRNPKPSRWAGHRQAWHSPWRPPQVLVRPVKAFSTPPTNLHCVCASLFFFRDRSLFPGPSSLPTCEFDRTISCPNSLHFGAPASMPCGAFCRRPAVFFPSAAFANWAMKPLGNGKTFPPPPIDQQILHIP